MVEVILKLYLFYLDEDFGIKILENVIVKGNMLGFFFLFKFIICIINFLIFGCIFI